MLIDFARGTATETIPEERVERLHDAPPSAKLVYKVLEIEGALTGSQIAEETRLPDRTARHALGELKAADLVTETIHLPDARKKVYRPRPVSRLD